MPTHDRRAFVAFHDNGKYPNVGWFVEDNGCHTWAGYRDNHGYGIVRWKGGNYRAHRARYLREVGAIPDGYVLDHYVCDGGPLGCCNPLHVRPVTHRENSLRGETIAAKCSAKTHCPHGHPYSGENLFVTRNGKRMCRICKRAAKKRYYEANKEKYIASTSAYAKRKRLEAKALLRQT